MLANAHQREVDSNIRGDLCSGTTDDTMVRAPFSNPEDPIPATARAMINILEELAIPHSSDPSSKMKKNTIKVHYIMVNFD